MPLTPDDIETRFGKHAGAIEGPNPKEEDHRWIRVLFKEMAENLDQELSEGRNKSLAFTALEEASMWAHKSVAND